MSKPSAPSFTIDPQTGTWGLKSPHADVRGVTTRLFLNHQWVNLFSSCRVRKVIGNKYVIEGKSKEGLASRMTVSRIIGLPAFCIDVDLTNTSNEAITLGTLHLLDVGIIQLGTKGNVPKVFVDSGGGWWAGAVDADKTSPYQEQWDMLPLEDKTRASEILSAQAGPGHHTSIGGISALHNPRTRSTIVAAFLTFNRSSSHVTWLYRPQKGFIGGWAANNFAGYRLLPGQSIRSEAFFIGFYNDPHQGLSDYATRAGKKMKVKLPRQAPLGWCSWYAYRLKMTEDLVLANAEVLKKRLGAYPFSYIQADHGWQYKDITGHWTQTNERFPHGLKWLAKNLDALGYRLGLWLGVFVVLESSPLFQEHPEYMIKDSLGNPQAMPYTWAWEPHDRIYYLDPTHPGAQKFLRTTYSTLRNAGVRYWKIDFPWGIANNDPEAHYHDARIVKGAETYRMGLSKIMDVVGEDYVYWCSNPIMLGFGMGSTSMTACDIGNPGFAQARQVEGRTENLDFFRQCATTIISRYYLHRKLILLNPDVVEVAGNCEFDEARIRLSLVAFAGGQVFLGDDLTTLSDDQWDLLTKCIPPLGQAARPVDLFEHTYPSSYPHIWHLPIRTQWGEWDLVALFNLTTEPLKVKVTFTSLKLKKNAEYLVFEFWDQKFLGLKKNAVTVELKPVSTRLLLIKKPSREPMVLSTDMHVTQGAVELSRVGYDKKTKTLSGLARRHPGAKGKLFLWTPKSKTLIVQPLVFEKPTFKWKVSI